MTLSQELDNFGRHPKSWTVTAVNWVLENPEFKAELMIRSEIKDPAKEVEVTNHLETVDARPGAGSCRRTAAAPEACQPGRRVCLPSKSM